MRPDPDHAPDRVPDAGRLPRRGTDRAEDLVVWSLTAAGLLLIMVAVVTGLAVFGSETERAQTQTVSPTRAVLLEDAEPAVYGAGGQASAMVPVRWTDRSGNEHTGTVLVRRPAAAGTEIDVWVDVDSDVSARPVTRVNAIAAGVAAAFGILCAGGTLIAWAWIATRRVCDRLNARGWAREWDAVEPKWRRNLL